MLLSKSALLGLATLVASALSQASEELAVAPDNSKVIKLSDVSKFDQFVKENDLFLTEFFAPWCGHCKKLGPEYVKAADSLSELDIPLVQINCDDNQEFCRGMDIPGYPTLKIFKNGKSKDYVGARTNDSIVDTMIKNSLPVVVTLDSKTDIAEFVKDSVLPVIVNTNNNLNNTFHSVAEQLSDEYNFVTLSKLENDKKGQLNLYPADAQELTEPFTFISSSSSSDEEEKELVNWIKIQSLPYFGDINGQTFQQYMDSDLPLAYFFYTSPEERAKYAKDLTKLATKFRGKLNFVGLDSTQFGKHADNVNIKQQFPAFVIHNLTSNLKYALPQLDEEKFAALTKPYSIKQKDITNHVEKFIKGDLKPTVKSEEEPETQESNVFKIVATTHDKIIADPKKDVLVKYYAPWCGHCKRLAPTYEELADAYNFDKSAKDKVVIAEVDATANDISSVDIEGFPTIVLYPAGKDNEPITYQGDRSLQSFFEFIHKNGQNDIDGNSIYQKYQDAKEQEVEEVEDDEEAHDEL
ncbi:protein disulfide-isomerase [Monosporozyma servazzii]